MPALKRQRINLNLKQRKQMNKELNALLKAKGELKGKLKRGDIATAARIVNRPIPFMSQWFSAQRFTKHDAEMIGLFVKVVKERKAANGRAIKEAERA